MDTTSTWKDVEDAAGDLALAVRARFEATGLGLLATLRRDDSPRISGIEPWFTDDGLWMGMMHDSRKARDLQRDPRCALHAATIDKEVSSGDAKVSGLACEVSDDETMSRALRGFRQDTGNEVPPGPMHLFAVHVTELVLVEVVGAHLELRVWTPEQGHRVIQRS
jgi:nitroimidazol reductase NimA-like FMN-containing flavoprotein (pyridoxamine 5'-phosphate oxidase superfamily)